jgi:hypothetical protein
MPAKSLTFLPTPAPSRLSLILKPAPACDQESRIREALEVGRGPLPRVGIAWLRKYYTYLSAALDFPFAATCPEDSGLVRPLIVIVSVVTLLPPSGSPGHQDAGLWCRAQRGTSVLEVPVVDLELETDHRNAQLIEDYWYWFWNWRFDPRI